MFEVLVKVFPHVNICVSCTFYQFLGASFELILGILLLLLMQLNLIKINDITHL